LAESILDGKKHKHRLICLQAHPDQQVTPSASALIKLCTSQTFSKVLGVSKSAPEIFVGLVLPVQDTAPNIGKGSEHAQIAPLLAQFTGVLPGGLPAGLPFERLAADGTPTEHTIETAPDVQPNSAKLPPL
jgi:hypothetical protein